KAKAAYAKGRKLVDGAFLDLLDQTADSIKTVEDLRIAKLFFEAFMGFYKLKKGD
ncbi:MAG TPA: type III-A CRISPR-associated protein Csm2, partial [Chromatiaceae bacterium]|nr:type III-A CRISPR-associated protein Csm2 [Chromatiaceae bacterium]